MEFYCTSPREIRPCINYRPVNYDCIPRLGTRNLSMTRIVRLARPLRDAGFCSIDFVAYNSQPWYSLKSFDVVVTVFLRTERPLSGKIIFSQVSRCTAFHEVITSTYNVLRYNLITGLASSGVCVRTRNRLAFMHHILLERCRSLQPRLRCASLLCSDRC